MENESKVKKGISLNQKDGKYHAYIHVNRKKFNLGRYDTFEEATCIREEAERHQHTDFEAWYEEKKPQLVKIRREIKENSTIGNIHVLTADGKGMYHAKCMLCGHQFSGTATKLLNYAERGYCGQCGKQRRVAQREAEAKTYIGRAFSDVDVIGYAGLRNRCSTSTYQVPVMECKCRSCGNVFEIPFEKLMAKHGRGCPSCGRKRHEDSIRDSFVEGTSILGIYERKTNKNNRVGVKGVCLKNGKYRAYISFQGKQYHLGFFDNLEEAANARAEAEKRIYGGFLEWYEEKYPESWAKVKNMKAKNEKK